MIIIKIMGGLGNQLQQYALYRRILKEDVPAKLDMSWFNTDNQADMGAPRKCELNYLEGIDYETATKDEISKLTGGSSIIGSIRRRLKSTLGIGKIAILNEEKRIYLEDEMNDICDRKTVTDMYIEGYFANEVYYSKVLADLRKEISFPVEKAANSDKIKIMAHKMKEENSVSIHIRRGDYLNPENAAGFGGICTDEYYDESMKICMEKMENPCFYIFSDDTEYANEFKNRAKEKFNLSDADITVVNLNENDDNYFDMYLMSCCKANIVANSTFSFWGARLNGNIGKIMIRPTIHRNGQVFDADKMKEWWKDWTFVSPQGDRA